MYLALKEIMHSKLRYTLVVAITFLIAYMVFFTTSLALGLVRDNRSGIDAWEANNIVLSDYANKNLTASFIPKNTYEGEISADKAMVGYTPAVLNKDDSSDKLNVSIFAQDWNSFIAPKITTGRAPENDNEVVVDKSLKNNNEIELGSKIQLNGSKNEYTVVGVSDDNKFLTAPLVYTNMNAYWTLKGTQNGSRAISAIVLKNGSSLTKDGLVTLSKEDVINHIPGYSAQNSVFEGMIGALVIISSLIIGIFIYIITIQKLGMYGVMRAQGVRSTTIINALFSQIFILATFGVVVGLFASYATSFILPAGMFFEINWTIYIALALGMIVISLIGGLISLPKILKVSPIEAISE